MPFLTEPGRKEQRCAGAFTLVELLVVVLILGVLLSVAIPLYLRSVRASSIQAVKANLRLIAHAAQAYRVRYGRYPNEYANSSGYTIDPNFIGPGMDLASLPAGPRKVYYRWGLSTGSSAPYAAPFSPPLPASYAAASTGPGQFIVQAKENGEDVFGGQGTTNMAYYNLSTGKFGDSQGEF